MSKDQAIAAFLPDVRIKKCIPFGNGHINDTFRIETDDAEYILQRVNTAIFTEPEKMMGNIDGITSYIRELAKKEGRDPSRATLTFLKTAEGKNCFFDNDGTCFRLCVFVKDCTSKERVNGIDDFRSCGEAFGNFQRILSEYPAHTLCETIPNFHNTPKRYRDLMNAAEADVCGRAESVKAEIDFARDRREFCEVLERAYAAGELPLRVTHNDTKLNNILFDKYTDEALCVIDLDTVMPGFSVNDFGDSIRFGANTAAEDETDLSKVSLDLELFRAYADGFIKGCGGKLTKKEIELLPIGAIMMTLECGMRFLEDHLKGDVYFKIHREGHNLDRCRNQFALVADMEKKLDAMREIVLS